MDEEARRKHREYMRLYRARNREHDREYQKRYFAAYYEKHGDEIRARAAAWYQENRERAIEASRKRYDSKPKKGYLVGDRNHLWKGDSVGYEALHRWVSYYRGRPSLCDHCGTTTAKRFEWANIDHQYKRVLEDWLRLCTSCHRRHDYANGLSKHGGRSAGRNCGNDGRSSWRNGYPSARSKEPPLDHQ